MPGLKPNHHKSVRLKRYALSAICALCLQGVLLPAAHADGVAVFASVSDSAGVAQERAQLESILAVGIATSQVDINGTTWTRLQSEVMSESAARQLVATAQSNGYSAWYIGSGAAAARLSGTSAAPGSATIAVTNSGSRPTGALTADPYSRGEVNYAENSAGTEFSFIDPGSSDQGSSYSSDAATVTPASEDISHLPLAETFPIE